MSNKWHEYFKSCLKNYKNEMRRKRNEGILEWINYLGITINVEGKSENEITNLIKKRTGTYRIFTKRSTKEISVLTKTKFYEAITNCEKQLLR